MKNQFLKSVEKLADILLGSSFQEVEAATGKRIYEKIEHPKKKNGRCSMCGFRIRSNNHCDGMHHKSLKRKND